MIPRLKFRIALVLLATVACVAPAAADGTAEHRIRAAYLLNFAKFVRWPADAMPSEWHFCVVAPRAVRDLYSAMLNGKRAQDQRVTVSTYSDAVPENAGCHLLYIAGGARLGSQPGRTLSIGDREEFVRAGGMLAFVRVGDHVRFVANLAAIRAAGLDVDSQLLAVAHQVMR